LLAKRHSFDENLLPQTIVADSSFLFDAVMDTGAGRYERAISFAGRLRDSNCIVVYSSLIFLEAPQCWRRMYARGLLLPDHIENDVTRDRINAFRKADNALNDLLTSFLRRRFVISRRLMKAASVLVARFNLSAHDALIVAVAHESRVPHLVTFDRDFRRVDWIELWDGLLIP
jgi:predicted nucleic acid-binding protein